MKNLSLLFAKRYLVSRKSHSVINIISVVSAFAIGVPVAAMIILLSVFNGFESLVKSMYKEFDPDIAITAAEGKTFAVDTFALDRLLAVEQVEGYSFTLEDNALLEYRGRQVIATVRGVDSLYHNVVPIEGMITGGRYQLWFGSLAQAVVGQGIAYNLGVRRGLFDRIKVLVPRRGGHFSSLMPVNSYKQDEVFPEAVFMLDAETDNKYIIVPLEFTRELFDYPSGATTLMVRLRDGANPDAAREAISAQLGDDYKVLTRYQQKASIYKIMVSEKWGIFAIILMVMVIASFSIIGSLVMLVIDKRKDIRTVLTIGGSIGLARSIFVKEGMLVSMIGAVGGMAVGLLFCWAQATWGFIKIPADTFLVSSYPVEVRAQDVAVVIVAFIAVSYIITKFTVVKMIPKSQIRI